RSLLRRLELPLKIAALAFVFSWVAYVVWIILNRRGAGSIAIDLGKDPTARDWKQQARLALIPLTMVGVLSVVGAIRPDWFLGLVFISGAVAYALWSDRVFLTEQGLYTNGRFWNWTSLESFEFGDGGRCAVLRTRAGLIPAHWILLPLPADCQGQVEAILRDR